MGLAVRDRVGLVALEDPARDRVDLGLVGLVGQDLEAPAGQADLENPAAQEDREGTNPAALVDTNLGVMADTGLADREGPANRVDREDLVGLVDTNRVDLEDLGDRGSLVDLADTNRAVRGPRDRDRVAWDLGQNRAHLGRTALSLAHLGRAALSRAHLRRNLPDPDLTRARPHRIPAHLRLTRARPHRMPAHRHQIPARLREPTHPGVATHLPVRTRQAEAIHPVAVTPVAVTHPAEATADIEGAKPLDCEFIWQSSGFGCCTQLCI